jgi:hypothetical protein
MFFVDKEARYYFEKIFQASGIYNGEFIVAADFFKRGPSF